jgi:molybdopterin molybdotransferase
MRIATGGMLPEGADAVVMVEHAQAAGADLVEVFSTVAPGEGLVRAGDDARAGDVLVPRGRRLRPQEIGALAAAGVTRVEVYRLPRVAILPTGDEIVPPEHPPGPGQVRDVNSALLAAALRECGAAPLPYPILPDNPDALRAAATDALAHADMLLVAGGSSVGARDWTLDVLTSLPGARLLFHGAAIRPGKPVLAVALGDRLMVGLPGNPLSALIVFRQLLRPYLARLAGETHAAHLRPRLAARLAASYASEPGKEDYVRVRLVPGQEGLRATPLPGKSALLRTLLEADGIVVVPDAVEGLEAGDSVEVEPL